jgi:D-alanyl-D-alanine carboxypeptidase
VTGAAAAVVVPGEGTWSGASGVADKETEEAVTADTLFAFGSVTKTFVAALVLDLAEDGVLRLDDPLAKWMPSFPRARAITVRQLLNHTSGVYDVTENPAFFRAQIADPRQRWTADRTLRFVKEPRFAPGSDWAYSNTNYILLGKVIETATRSRVSRQLRRRILEPTGADAVFVQGEEPVRGRGARPYSDVDEDGRQDDISDGTSVIPNTAMATAAWTAGGLAATPEAVARFADALFRGRLLEPRSLEQMLDVDTRGVGRGAGLGYGLGIARFDVPGHGVVWGHGGGIPGFRAQFFHAADDGITIVVAWTAERQDPTLVSEPLLEVALRHSQSD